MIPLYYETAANCRFLTAYPIWNLPDGADWAFEIHGKKKSFYFGGKKYLLGVSPKGFLLGFPLDAKASDKAEICFVKPEFRTEPFALCRSAIPEEHITPLFQQMFVSRLSGQLLSARTAPPQQRATAQRTEFPQMGNVSNVINSSAF